LNISEIPVSKYLHHASITASVRADLIVIFGTSVRN
jgi:hypothetical protein